MYWRIRHNQSQSEELAIRYQSEVHQRGQSEVKSEAIKGDETHNQTEAHQRDLEAIRGDQTHNQRRAYRGEFDLNAGDSCPPHAIRIPAWRLSRCVLVARATRADADADMGEGVVLGAGVVVGGGVIERPPTSERPKLTKWSKLGRPIFGRSGKPIWPMKVARD